MKTHLLNKGSLTPGQLFHSVLTSPDPAGQHTYCPHISVFFFFHEHSKDHLHFETASRIVAFYSHMWSVMVSSKFRINTVVFARGVWMFPPPVLWTSLQAQTSSAVNWEWRSMMTDAASECT